MALDHRALTEQVQTRIRSTLIDIFTEEQWRELVASEVNAFTTPGPRDYRGEYTPSPLTALIHTALSEHIRAILKKEFESKEWVGFWNGQEQQIGPKMADLIRENAGPILESILRSTLGQFISNFRQSL